MLPNSRIIRGSINKESLSKGIVRIERIVREIFGLPSALYFFSEILYGHLFKNGIQLLKDRNLKILQ